MSEKDQEDSQTIGTLNQKINDIQFVNKIIIIFIILIFATQAAIITESPDIPSSGLSALLQLVTVAFLFIAVIIMFCTRSNEGIRSTS